MYGCESWSVKKAEHRRIDAFELWCWRSLSRVHWTTRRSHQSILKDINPEHSLEGLLLNLCLVAQLCPNLCDPMDCSLPGPSVHGDSPGKNTGVGCHALLHGIFPTQGSNPGLSQCRQILYCLSRQGSPSPFKEMSNPVLAVRQPQNWILDFSRLRRQLFVQHKSYYKETLS